MRTVPPFTGVSPSSSCVTMIASFMSSSVIAFARLRSSRFLVSAVSISQATWISRIGSPPLRQKKSTSRPLAVKLLSLKNRGEMVGRPGAGKLNTESLGFMEPVPFVRHAFQGRPGPVGHEQGAVEKHLLVPSRDILQLEMTITEPYGHLLRDA